MARHLEEQEDDFDTAEAAVYNLLEKVYGKVPPYIHLMTAIMLQAARDRKHKPSKYTHDFLSLENKGYILYCERAGLDPVAFLEYLETI